jgi:hypothetical protein
MLWNVNIKIVSVVLFSSYFIRIYFIKIKDSIKIKNSIKIKEVLNQLVKWDSQLLNQKFRKNVLK